MDTGRNGDLRGRVNVRVSIIFSVLSSKWKNQSQLIKYSTTVFLGNYLDFFLDSKRIILDSEVTLLEQKNYCLVCDSSSLIGNIILSGKASGKRQGLTSFSNTSSGLIFSSHWDVSFKFNVVFITNKASSSIVGTTADFCGWRILTTYNLHEKCIDVN